MTVAVLYSHLVIFTWDVSPLVFQNKFKTSEALHIRQPLKYPDTKSSRIDGDLSTQNEETNWRNKVSSYRQETGEVEVVSFHTVQRDI